MKPRVLVTFKILAVALTAATGCSRAAGPAPHMEGMVEPSGKPSVAQIQSPPVTVEIAGEQAASAIVEPVAASPRSGLSVDPAPATAASAPPPPPPAPPPAPAAAGPMSEDPALLALRDEMAGVKRARALAQKARFRPLCDAQGYPLVGNLIRKGPTPEVQPSAFCGEVRKQRVGEIRRLARR